MMTNLEPMACGNCGHGLFRMYSAQREPSLKLIAQCNKCRSTSIIEPAPAALQIEFGEHSDGRLCCMRPTG